MHNGDRFLKELSSAAFKAGLIVIALVGYGSRRTWVLSIMGNIYNFGFFEGALSGIFIFGIFSKYGQPFYEAFQGLREIGRKGMQNPETP